MIFSIKALQKSHVLNREKNMLYDGSSRLTVERSERDKDLSEQKFNMNIEQEAQSISVAVSPLSPQ